jgi:hypothetical protein
LIAEDYDRNNRDEGNLACVGEINYKSASLEGAAYITTPSAFNSYIMLHHGLINYKEPKQNAVFFTGV